MAYSDAVAIDADWYIGRVWKPRQLSSPSDLGQVIDVCGPLAVGDIKRFFQPQTPWHVTLSGEDKYGIARIQGFIPLADRKDVLPMPSLFFHGRYRRVQEWSVLNSISTKFGTYTRSRYVYLLYASTHDFGTRAELKIWDALPEPTVHTSGGNGPADTSKLPRSLFGTPAPTPKPSPRMQTTQGGQVPPLQLSKDGNPLHLHRTKSGQLRPKLSGNDLNKAFSGLGI